MDFPFEAVLGQPDVRNFREGGGNVLHGLVATATPLERADTSEATGLHTYAPPLYSADRSRIVARWTRTGLLSRRYDVE
ncbi:MAG: hypothetical protein H0U18_16450 [Pyrinomonadaceae bacterium]|nr:hypothetical protein [Pyrinomonadaceae bacterium]